jgi:putative transposase
MLMNSTSWSITAIPRNVLSWKLSNSLVTEFCLKALEMALGGCRRPEIFHFAQGRQFTSSDFVACLQAKGIKITWSGKNRCYDSIDGWEAEISLARFLWRYCHVRPHSSLGDRTPNDVYTEIELCSSRPELTRSGTGTVQ